MKVTKSDDFIYMFVLFLGIRYRYPSEYFIEVGMHTIYIYQNNLRYQSQK